MFKHENISEFIKRWRTLNTVYEIHVAQMYLQQICEVLSLISTITALCGMMFSD